MSSAVPSAATQARVVLVTAPDDEIGRNLARRAVELRLAACVNLLPRVTSVYRWQGAVEESSETLLVLKTSSARVPEIERWLADEHPYDLPECVVLAPLHVEAKYLRWLLDATSA